MTNNNWCNPKAIKTLSCSCSLNLEHLTISYHPFYLPQEFSPVITAVYVPPQYPVSMVPHLLQEIHYCPCAWEGFSSFLEWLPTGGPHLSDHEMLWEADQGLHLCLLPSEHGPAAVRISAKQINGWCCLSGTAHHTFSSWQPGGRLCKTAVHWLQFSFQNHSPHQTGWQADWAGTDTTNTPPVCLDSGLPDHQAPGGQGGQTHLQPPHPEHRIPPELHPQPPTVLPVHT